MPGALCLLHTQLIPPLIFQFTNRFLKSYFLAHFNYAYPLGFLSEHFSLLEHETKLPVIYIFCLCFYVFNPILPHGAMTSMKVAVMTMYVLSYRQDPAFCLTHKWAQEVFLK